jgi:hypothetical protein
MPVFQEWEKRDALPLHKHDLIAQTRKKDAEYGPVQEEDDRHSCVAPLKNDIYMAAVLVTWFVDVATSRSLVLATLGICLSAFLVI